MLSETSHDCGRREEKEKRMLLQRIELYDYYLQRTNQLTKLTHTDISIQKERKQIISSDEPCFTTSCE